MLQELACGPTIAFLLEALVQALVEVQEADCGRSLEEALVEVQEH